MTRSTCGAAAGSSPDVGERQRRASRPGDAGAFLLVVVMPVPCPSRVLSHGLLDGDFDAA
jgi:hypothetical protein